MNPDVQLYPLLFEPVYMHNLWGGGRIPGRFNRPPVEGTCAESWEVSDRPEGMSVVTNGPLAGASLHELVASMGPELVGRPWRGDRFPLLIKIIDAGQTLSVQVHPDDHSAAQYGGEAKTEMWYILGAEPGASILAGFRPGANRQDFEQALPRGRLAELLHTEPAVAGQAIFVPGGRVHAIGEGCLLLEVQQNSNTTYRVYDWGRLGSDRQPRELHVEKALEVINWCDGPAEPVTPTEKGRNGKNTFWDVLSCPYFAMERIALREPEACVHDGASFHALFVEKGTVRVEGGSAGVELSAGVSCLLPAALTHYTLTPRSGAAHILRTTRGASRSA